MPTMTLDDVKSQISPVLLPHAIAVHQAMIVAELYECGVNLPEGKRDSIKGSVPSILQLIFLSRNGRADRLAPRAFSPRVKASVLGTDALKLIFP
jgi:hypothetical protein